MKKIIIVLLVIFMTSCQKDLDIEQENSNDVTSTTVSPDKTILKEDPSTTTETAYSNWMKDIIPFDSLIVNIAMLGAHDAFSCDIDLNSEVDPYLEEKFFRGATGSIFKNTLVGQSKAQSATATTMLEKGVRYFDIRLSYYDNKWLTKHNYISSNFEEIAYEITDYIDTHNGEFLILDFQHIHGINYDSKEDYIQFKTMLEEYKLLEYAYIVQDISTLNYGVLTNNGTKSKIIILSPFVDAEGEILNRNKSIRSKWANSDDFDSVIEFLRLESKKSSDYLSIFRVMQGVTTMQTDLEGVTNTLSKGTLLERAVLFNSHLVNDEEFNTLLETLPIVMIDNVAYEDNDLHKTFMEKIITFNS